MPLQLLPCCCVRQDTESSTEDEEAQAAADEYYANAEGLATSRARREQKSRITYVDGIPVLRNNMYDLNQGEPSVFQEVAEKKKQRKRKWVRRLRLGQDREVKLHQRQGWGCVAAGQGSKTASKARVGLCCSRTRSKVVKGKVGAVWSRLRTEAAPRARSGQEAGWHQRQGRGVKDRVEARSKVAVGKVRAWVLRGKKQKVATKARLRDRKQSQGNQQGGTSGKF
eukprot:1161755-Pelagomonas_calceolata.AAC.16